MLQCCSLTTKMSKDPLKELEANNRINVKGDLAKSKSCMDGVSKTYEKDRKKKKIDEYAIKNEGIVALREKEGGIYLHKSDKAITDGNQVVRHKLKHSLNGQDIKTLYEGDLGVPLPRGHKEIARVVEVHCKEIVQVIETESVLPNCLDPSNTGTPEWNTQREKSYSEDKDFEESSKSNGVNSVVIANNKGSSLKWNRYEENTSQNLDRIAFLDKNLSNSSELIQSKQSISESVEISHQSTLLHNYKSESDLTQKEGEHQKLVPKQMIFASVQEINAVTRNIVDGKEITEVTKQRSGIFQDTRLHAVGKKKQIVKSESTQDCSLYDTSRKTNNITDEKSNPPKVSECTNTDSTNKQKMDNTDRKETIDKRPAHEPKDEQGYTENQNKQSDGKNNLQHARRRTLVREDTVASPTSLSENREETESRLAFINQRQKSVSQSNSSLNSSTQNIAGSNGSSKQNGGVDKNIDHSGPSDNSARHKYVKNDGKDDHERSLSRQSESPTEQRSSDSKQSLIHRNQKLNNSMENIDISNQIKHSHNQSITHSNHSLNQSKHSVNDSNKSIDHSNQNINHINQNIHHSKQSMNQSNQSIHQSNNSLNHSKQSINHSYHSIYHDKDTISQSNQSLTKQDDYGVVTLRQRYYSGSDRQRNNYHQKSDKPPNVTNTMENKYKSMQNINAATNELALIPIRPPRRPKSEMCHISYKKIEDYNREYDKRMKLQRSSSRVSNLSRRSSSRVSRPEEMSNRLLQQQGNSGKTQSDAVLNTQETLEVIQKHQSVNDVYTESQKVINQAKSGSSVIPKARELPNKKSTDNDIVNKSPEQQRPVKRDEGFLSRNQIPRAKSEKYLPDEQKGTMIENKQVALSMNQLNDRSLSLQSGLTERSETLSELELSSCTSDTTIFATSARATVLRKQPEENQTQRWVEGIIASQGNFHLQGLLTCTICKQLFRNPYRLAGCLHSFCKQCMAELQDQGDSTGISCPLCGVITNPGQSRANLFFEELIDIHRLGMEEVSSRCRQCPEGVEPSWKCMDCKLDLCDKCHTIHKMIPLLQGHSIVQLTNTNDMTVDRLVFCDKHHEEPVKFNCKDCEVTLCIKCKVTEHDTHKIETPDVALKRILPELHFVTENLEENLQNLRDKIKEVDYKTDVTMKTFDKCRDDIDKKAEEEIARIRKTQNKLKEELKVRRDMEIAALNRFMFKLQQKQNQGNNLRDLVTISIMRGRQVSLLSEIIDGLYKQVKSYKIEIQKEANFQTAHPKLAPNTKVDGLFEEGFLGKINYHTIKVLSSGAIPSYKRFMCIKFEEFFTNQLHKSIEINLPDQCLSISLVNDQIWAVFPYMGIIQTFSIYGDLVGYIQLENIQPRAIHQTCEGDVLLACQFTGVYILDCESGEIHSKLTPGKFSDVCIRDDRIFALEYNNKQVMVFSKGDMTTNNCCGGLWSHVCNIDVSQVEKIDSVSTLLIHEQYEDHIYVASYNAHSIFHFNQRGELLGRYGRKGRQVPGELYNPMLCSVDKLGFLLLADGENKRLQILDVWGMWRIINLEGLKKPYMVTTDTRQNIWVSQFNDQFHTWQLVKYVCDLE